MSSQLWAPLSISLTSASPVSSDVALQHVDSFLHQYIQSIGQFDQNTLASLNRLRTGLEEQSVFSRARGSPAYSPEKSTGEDIAAGKKRKREKKAKEAVEQADITSATAEDDSPKKKKKTSKKEKDAVIA